MSTLSDIRTKVIAEVKDNSAKLTNPTDYDQAIGGALEQYSKHRPDTKVVDVTGNGGHDYDLPSGWVDGFSSVKSIEYPVGNVPETLLEQVDDYTMYQSPTKKQIRMISNTPETTETFRVTFAIPRTATTVLDGDVNALVSLAASICLDILANAYTQTGDSTINADSVDYRSKGGEFAARAKKLLKVYKDHMGIKEDDTVPAASAVADLDMRYPGGSDRLTHPRWARERR